jgi:DNA primase
MLKINEVYYELSLKDIILELKNQLAINGIYLFNQIKELPEDLMVSCPFHKDGQERKASCGIRKSDGWTHCFSCGESCSLEQLISRCFGYADFGQYGLNWLTKNFLGEIAEKRDLHIDLDRNIKQITPEYITDIELNKYRYYHPYMFTRKMNERVIEIFDIGFDKATQCITFPVRDENGNCLFIARRSVNIKYFNYPSNVEKPVYGLYELKKYANNPDEIYVCESMINAITLWVYGKYAVALNGTGTKSQIEQLKKINCRKLILALDPDKAGRLGSIKLYKNLKNYKIITFLAGIPEGKDINDLDEEQFKKLYEIF